MTSVSEAAERLRELRPETLSYMRTKGGVELLACAYLDLVPADDGEVIDQGFLIDYGFQLSEPCASVVIWKLGELWLVCTALGNEWKWNGCSIESWPKTRGELRRLMVCLGIPLATPNTK